MDSHHFLAEKAADKAKQLSVFFFHFRELYKIIIAVRKNPSKILVSAIY